MNQKSPSNMKAGYRMCRILKSYNKSSQLAPDQKGVILPTIQASTGYVQFHPKPLNPYRIATVWEACG